MFDENSLMDRANRAEARASALDQAYKSQIEKIAAFKGTMGLRERSDGSIVIDFETFAKALPADQALELRAVIDEVHNISGEAGQKPRIRLTSKDTTAA